MKFDDLFSRADEEILQQILGEKTVRILTNLDQTKSYNNYLRKLILNLHGYEGLILNKNYRGFFFDLLREEEARDLALLIGVEHDLPISQLYEKLKKKLLRRGSLEEKNLFEYFDLIPPPVESKEIIPSKKQQSSVYPLFEHQRRAALRVKEMLDIDPYRALLHMPTGAGKTRTAMNLITEHLRKQEPTVVVWLAASEELCDQAAEEFEKAWSFLGNRELAIYRFWGEHSINIDDIQDGLVVVGLPKIVRAMQGKGGISFLTNLAKLTSLVVMDEAHQAIAPTYRTVIETLFYVGKQNRLLGLSATPGRTWNNINADEELASFFARRKVRLEVDGYSNPINYLTDQGYLAKVTYRQLLYGQGKITEKDLKTISESIDIPLNVLKTLGEDEQRNLKIINETEQLVQRHKRIILFAPSAASSNLLASILQARGYQAYSVTSDTESSKRKNIIEQYKENTTDTVILCNYGVLTTGFDAPQTSAAIIARPTISLVLYSQMVGRAIRGIKAGGNKEAEIVTIVDQELPGFRSVAESFDNWEDVWV
ncbi:DEAD/DEAH box helicase [Brevibacillus brevis]|uniref:DEAD/DEAH box helicase n=1 Tax=Brevibacillus brevis TaxID=1393 RepID=UPI001C8D7846|nr:DEAD/DEAH box helicase family protein [Brevibacillus brevis]MBY0086978.1 DEAD/DEAH box helicase family protein [Brevibacillus brevis]